MSTDREPITIWAPTSIEQSTRDRLKELIRLGGVRFLAANRDRTVHSGDWRNRTFLDGIVVDLDEDDVLFAIVDTIIRYGSVPEEHPPIH